MNVSLFSRSLLLAAFSAASLAAVTPQELADRLSRREAVLLVDVRPATAYTEGHIPGAINVPLSLLRHKPLPSAQPVVVYGDGLGLVNETQALEWAQAKPGVKAELLEGGYAGWMAATRLSTGATGVSAEKLPNITYDQLLAANKEDVVLVDLRTPAASDRSASARSTGLTAASVESDVLGNFAAKLGVPVIAAPGRGDAGVAAARSSGAALRATSAEGTSKRASSNIAVPAVEPGKLLVLVADDEAAATELARQLRASGHYRFTILIGGTEIIRHEGRQGLGRMDGRPTPVQQ